MDDGRGVPRRTGAVHATCRGFSAEVQVVPPLPAIPGTRVPVPVPLAKPERLYFKLLDPVDPRALGAHRDTAAAEAVYRDVQSAIYR